MNTQGSIVGLLRRRPRAVTLLNAGTQHCTRTSVRHATASFLSNGVAPQPHQFLSVQQALQTAQSSHASASGSFCGSEGGAATAAASLTFTLPPLCVWGASLHTPSQDDGQAHMSRHATSSATSSRYASLWSPVEAYLAELHSFTPQSAHRGTDASHAATTTAPPPVCVALRLFPDLTVAQLPTTYLQVPRSAKELCDWGGHDESVSLKRPRRRLAAPHEQPLAAILAMEEPWGSGADAQMVFRHALDGLREIGQRLLPQVALLLQLPTRLLVSQQFLEDVAALLVRSGWRSVAFELPSTHQLYSPCHPSSSSSSSPGPLKHDSGAVDGAWCHLPLLCTPWSALCRHPSLGPALRRLRRHDVVPFHVLFSWALREARLFDNLEQSVVLDVTAPLPGVESVQARWQSPSSVGVSSEETRRAVQQGAKPASADTGSGMLAADEEAADEGDGSFGGIRNSPKQSRVFMSENPMTSGGAGVGLSSGVMDVVRRHQSPTTSSASASSTRADLTHAEAAWRRVKQTPQSTMAPSSPFFAPAALPGLNEASPLTLDAPPDHLRVLIEKSIAHSSDSADAAPTTTLTPRQRLMQQVGLFIQHTLHHDAAAAAAGEPAGSAAERAEEGELVNEAVELEELLRQANAASDAAAVSANLEHVMAEVQRYTRAHAQQTDAVALPDTSRPSHACHESDERHGGPAAGAADALVATNAWQSCVGYWVCMRALLSETTRASLVWTLPTYNAAAVRAWTEAFAASAKSATAESTFSPLPLVPVWMPLHSVMHAEVERLLREGQHFPHPPQHMLPGTGQECHTWLPHHLNMALHDALAQLPATTQAQQRRRLLLDYRVLRDAGAQGARRGGCDIRHNSRSAIATSTAAATAATSVEPRTEEAEAEEAASSEVVIRLRRGVHPFYLLAPSQVSKMTEEAERRLVAEAVESSTEPTTGDGTKALTAHIRDVNDTFMQEVTAYYRSANSAPQRRGGQNQSPQLMAASLYVPTPGLDATALHHSWRAIS